MSTSTLGTFVALLKKSQLLEAEQYGQVAGELCTRFPEAKALARELIRRGWVTAYQVNQISQGKTNDLVLGSYIILERLGEGAMGQVFKARHKSMGRTVALKTLKKERLAHPDAIKRFHREIQAAGRLSHPNIVMAYDADQVGNTHFFVMEYVEGTDLSNLVKKKGPLRVPRACNYIMQAAIGLQHAHEQGMVHRDIKPHNLLLTRDGRTVKILDMGLARLGEGDQDSAFSQLTHDGKVVGTPDYIAPEQARNSHTADIRSDIYSLGCTLYFLISARVPFPGGGSIMEKLMKHQTEEPIPIQLVAPELSDRVAEVVHKMIRRNPDERYQTPAEVAAALEPFAGGGDSEDHPGSAPSIQLGETGSLTTGTPSSGPRLKMSGPLSATSVQLPPPRRRIWPLLAALAGLFVLGAIGLGAVAVVLMGRSSPQISSKDHEPSPPDKDGDKDKEVKDKETKDKDKRPPDDRHSHLDQLAETPIPISKRPLHALPGLVGVFGEPRGRTWSGFPVSRLMFSRNGQLLASASGFGDPAVYIWDAETLQERGRLLTGTGLINFTFGADNAWLAAAAMDGTVRVFEVSEGNFGRVLAEYKIPSLGILQFSPDGRFGVSISANADNPMVRTLKVFETRSGHVRHSNTINEGIPALPTLAPNAPRLAVTIVNKDRSSVRIYDLDTDKLLHTIDSGTGFSIPLFLPDSKHLVVVTTTHIRTYEVASGALQHEVPAQNTFSPTLSPDGKLIVFLARTKDNKNSLHFYDVAAAKHLPHVTEVDSVLFFSQFVDSKTVVAFGPQKPAMIVDTASGKILPPLKGWNGGGMALAVSPNGRRLVMGTSEPSIRLWDLPSREEILPTAGRTGPVRFMAIGADRVLWTGSTETEGNRLVNVLRRWELPRGEPTVIRDATSTAATWAYDRHHHVVAYPHQISEGGSAVTVIKVVHAGNGREVATLPALPNGVWISALAFTPDGKSLACATWIRKENVNKSAIVFRDTTTGAEQFQIPERPEQVAALFFSRNGKVLASLGRDNNLKFFDVATHQEKTVPAVPGLTTQVLCMAWGPEGRMIATGGYPQQDQFPFRVWEAGSGKVPHRFPGKSMATAIALRHDGTMLAGADAEGHVTIWTLANDKPLRQWQLAGPATALRFSQDGRYLLTGNGNGTVYVFHIDSGLAPKP
jgi:serine/threonine protein kinase